MVPTLQRIILSSGGGKVSDNIREGKVCLTMNQYSRNKVMRDSFRSGRTTQMRPGLDKWGKFC